MSYAIASLIRGTLPGMGDFDPPAVPDMTIAGEHMIRGLSAADLQSIVDAIRIPTWAKLALLLAEGDEVEFGREMCRAIERECAEIARSEWERMR